MNGLLTSRQEIIQRTHFLTECDYPLILIVGDSGSGKTTLAEHILNQGLDPFQLKYFALTQKTQALQLRSQMIDHLFSDPLFNPELPLTETLQYLPDIHQNQLFLIDNAHFLSEELIQEFNQLAQTVSEMRFILFGEPNNAFYEQLSDFDHVISIRLEPLTLNESYQLMGFYYQQLPIKTDPQFLLFLEQAAGNPTKLLAWQNPSQQTEPASVLAPSIAPPWTKPSTIVATIIVLLAIALTSHWFFEGPADLKSPTIIEALTVNKPIEQPTSTALSQEELNKTKAELLSGQSTQQEPITTSSSPAKTAIANNEQQQVALAKTATANNEQQQVAPAKTATANNEQQQVAPAKTATTNNEQQQVAPAKTATANNEQQQVAPAKTATANNEQQQVALAKTATANNEQQQVAPAKTTTADNEQQQVALAKTTTADNEQQQVALAKTTTANNEQKAPTSILSYPLRDIDFFNQYPKEYYFLQLTGISQQQYIVRFVEDLNTELPVHIYYTQRRQAPWYTIILGPYMTIDAARTATQLLPQSVQSGQPFPKSVATITAELKLSL